MKIQNFGKPLSRLIIMVAICMLSLHAMAYDFSYTYQGKTLYYNITSDNTVEVTFYSSDNFFHNNNYVSGDVVIPSSVTNNGTTYSVTSIGYYAFSGCSSLTSVTISNSVTSIGEWAFSGCSSLTSVTIPNSVTSIGDEAFRSCSSLTSVTIGNSVTSIGEGAFSGCSSLTSITIPNSVTSIDDEAFRSCSSLTSVTIGNSVTSIGYWAFYGCSSLTSVTIPNSVTAIGNGAFSWCSSLTSVTIPNSVTAIGNSVFYYCSGLTSVTIPNSVTSIGDYAFVWCSGLTSVTLPNSVTSIGNYAFDGCSGLTSVTIPNGVTSIGYEAFYNCSGLTSVTIPNSVTLIGEWAFAGCSSLTTLNFNAINCNDFASGNRYQFYSCPLTSINIGDSVQRIPAYFAQNQSGLISIAIPDNVTEIGSRAFQGCSGLIAVTIGNGVNNIYSSSFRGCTNLTYLTIGSSVENIGDSAFIDCNILTSITSKATTPPEIASSNVFPYPNECSVTVPCGSLGAYADQMNHWYLLFNPRIEEDMVFTFSVSANDDAFGIVSNEALSCSVRKITATPFDGYEFVSWNDGNTSNPRTINITNDTSFVAVFAASGSSTLQEVESTREFVVYPNPIRGFATVEFEALQEHSLLRIADLGGRVIKTFDLSAGTESVRLDLRDLPSGVYTLMIGNTTKKLIVE